ncbi:hypothetical protein [Delftia sp. PE138]|uniref:hypothetical protein n=1 Tax=Delftia sp. PE138 TaxID=1812483 RepID=UPI001BAEBE82|nr:hypothetical protein [Delftia sp. PE138]MBS3723450.1 hypothetical protein [Delftia sp. PE138]
MTTAPTPSEKVQRLAITLEIVGAVPDMNYVTVPRHVARDASVELLRLQAENERLLAQVHKLEMDALDLASENSILKRAETDELEARKPLPPARVDELMAEAGYLGASAESRADFINGLRHAETAHSITGGSS